MGQAWCKEKSAKAQDSKSPLDRVFVRCAHRIYPSLKEEGSVFNGREAGGAGGGVASTGATQRVTSSEIGYIGSPPRTSMLQRGLSIDSVDRPFHPSEWVDVNLEVPCSPRDSVVLTRLSAITPELLQQRASSPSNSSLGPRRPNEEEAVGTPVPPPRRRRRSRRPLPPEPTGIHGNLNAVNSSSSALDDESDEFGHYSQLAGPIRGAVRDQDQDDAVSKNSDEEFIAIEESLKNRSLDQQQQQLQPDDPEQLYQQVVKKKKKLLPDAALTPTRPKNHSTTSLPNYAELEVPGGGSSELKPSSVERPPRHVKTASLPRDVAPFVVVPAVTSTSTTSGLSEQPTLQQQQQTPESKALSLSTSSDAWPADLQQQQQHEEEEVEEELDNSIFKAESFGPDVKTSTPVKAQELPGNPEDGSNEDAPASSSPNSSSCNPPAIVIEEVVEQGVEQLPQEESTLAQDPGYASFDVSESRNLTELFLMAERELSSGIIQDASGAELTQPQQQQQQQRTISEESLPGDMLDLEDSLEQPSHELVRQDSTSTTMDGSSVYKTPPPSPGIHSAQGDVSYFDLQQPEEEEEQERRQSVSEDVGLDESSTSADKDERAAEVDEGNPVSAATATRTNLTSEGGIVVVGGGGDESKSSEPQIAADVGQQQQQQEQKREQEQCPPPPSYDDVEFHKIDLSPSKTPVSTARLNPFNDYYKSNGSPVSGGVVVAGEFVEDAPEKPIRLYRISLVEQEQEQQAGGRGESAIQEPLIVPTPPRRKHRSKSNLHLHANTEVLEALTKYGVSNDRLI